MAPVFIHFCVINNICSNELHQRVRSLYCCCYGRLRWWCVIVYCYLLLFLFLFVDILYTVHCTRMWTMQKKTNSERNVSVGIYWTSRPLCVIHTRWAQQFQPGTQFQLRNHRTTSSASARCARCARCVHEYVNVYVRCACNCLIYLSIAWNTNNIYISKVAASRIRITNLTLRRNNAHWKRYGSH